MRTRKASDLQADVMALLDEVGSPKPTSSDLLEWLNQEWSDVYDHLIEADIKWNMRTSQFTTAANKDTYGAADGAFDATFYKSMGVDVQLSGSQWNAAHRFQFEQRNDYQFSDWSWPRRILYDVWGGTADVSGTDGTVLKFQPMPPGGFTVRHFWFPAPQRLVGANDVFDGVNGAEQAIIYGAAQRGAIQLEQYEQGDRWGALKAERVQRILSTLRDRNIGEAPMARLVRGRPTTYTWPRRWWGW